MRDTTERDKVLEEFTQGLFIWERPGERQYRMADEIVQLRAVLAALQEPSSGIVAVAKLLGFPVDMPGAIDGLSELLRAAVKVAQQEASA